MAPKQKLLVASIVQQICKCKRRTCFSQFKDQVRDIESKRAEFRGLPPSKQDAKQRLLLHFQLYSNICAIEERSRSDVSSTVLAFWLSR